MTLTDALLGPLLAADAARPLVTYYDDATGERIELSGTTLANWAAKTANLMRDECDLEPGARVAVLLPAHWQTLVVLLGAWWCGAEVVADPAGADLVCCDEPRL
ncbi:MAG TPA: TIGR03089 family protein, partial [Pseudonocardia sp.]|nr:TIGR03089 family protein [Pseudonocardia sp.]